MKKILTISIMIVLSLFITLPYTSADTILVDEPPTNTGGLWHEQGTGEHDNRVYVHMRYTDGSLVRETGSVTNSEYPDYDYSNVTYWESQKIYDDYEFPNTSTLKSATISNPDPTIYNQFYVEIISDMTVISGSEPLVKDVVSYTDVSVNEITVDLIDYIDPTYGDIFPYITLTINGVEVLSSQRTQENPYYNDQAFGVRMYWQKDGETIDIGTGDVDPDGDGEIDGSIWDMLPETSGNPSNPVGDWGTVSNFTVDEQQRVSFEIDYLGDTYNIIDIPFSGNLDFVDKANDILYYHDPNFGDKMLYFNFGQTVDSAMLLARNISTVNNWRGEALWNLSQNEVKVTNKLNVYNYIPEPDSNGNVYSYFYMPDIQMDELISVSALLAYKYYDDGFFGIGGGYGDTQYKTVAAVREESSTVNPTWVEKTYQTAYVTSALTLVGTIAGKIPGYGWAIAGATFLAGAVLNTADVNEWFAYEIDQIQNVIPSSALTNEINSYINTINGNDTFDPGTDKLYKLHLATLNDGDDVRVVNSESSVTQVVWETNGEIYVVNEENINNPDWGGPGTEFPDDVGGIDDTLLYVFGGALVIYAFNLFGLRKRPGLLILIVAGIVYLLYSGII